MNPYQIANLMKLAICSATIAGLWVSYRYPDSPRVKRYLDRSFLTLALLAIVGYVNLGFFHGGVGYIHTWEMFHYHLPSKYFQELGYSGLYEAALIADAESEEPHFDEVKSIRDLNTYALVAREDVLNSSTMPERFTPERWKEFSRDVDFFKGRYSPKRWKSLLRDHGYNAPPSRTVLTASVAGSLGPARDLSIYIIGLLDPLLLAILLWVVYRTYGLRLAALVTILFGVNVLSEFIWVGGAFLRFDWLVLCGLGICALRSNRYGLGGALLGGAVMLRIFPLFFAVGVVLRGVFLYSKSWIWHRRYTRFIAGLGLSGLGFLALTMIEVGGLDVWREFLVKIELHHAKLIHNNLGLRYVFGGHPLLLLVGQGAFLTAYLLSLRKLEDDTQAAILGGVLLFALSSLTCYYYAFLILFLLWQPHRPLDFRCWLFFSLLFMTQITVITLRLSGLTQSLVPRGHLSFFGASIVLLISFIVLLVQAHRPVNNAQAESSAALP
jgi:hypothetical protein